MVRDHDHLLTRYRYRFALITLEASQSGFLIAADMNEVARCRRDHNRLGFAYQIGFARLFNRFPAQQPLEINDELMSFVNGKTSFFTASMCSTRTTFAKTDP